MISFSLTLLTSPPIISCSRRVGFIFFPPTDIIEQKRGATALNIRNFSIIAHIDHGKSTLADRLIEMTGTIAKREMSDQVLDSMELERERGITIKAQTVRLRYTARDGQEYRLNLIDTPGHVDFTYEVSRSLAACEGALLVVDATQGVEAQTLSNVYLALDHDLEIIPVINKIDLPSADPDRAREEIEEAIGLDASGAILCSAKTGAGVDEILEAIVEMIPPPRGDQKKPLQALIFDSQFDSYKGAVAHVRVFDGVVRKGDRLKLLATGKEFEATELGYFSPSMTETGELAAGDVGYICGSLKDVRDVRVGDTITETDRPSEALPGYRAPMPMVFAGMYPTESVDYENLKDALEKLQLNDASLVYEPETSAALGFGFRCGFLGLLHMDVIQERLEREYNLTLVTTAPSVEYKVVQTDGEVVMVDNPAKLPPQTKISTISEPYVKATVMVPSDYIGAVMELCRERRGEYVEMNYIDKTRVGIVFELPLSEILYDFFDRLKSMTRGYASLDYEFSEYRESDLSKLDILLNGEVVDALSTIVHKSRAARVGRALALKLKRTIPRQMFEVVIQAAIGGRIIARTEVKPFVKDVLSKCYGGHIDRKKKLISRVKAGKKRMKAIGRVDVPQEAFMAVLELTDDDFV
ncbi:MAG: translation elongation factor 4 [Selenomonadaceae bacterium]|nr:translation elongation factor 4 [Selenomonadaceae bacterium]